MTVTWTKLAPIGAVHSGCLNCGSKPEVAPMDWQPHPGFGGLQLTRDGEVPPEWYEWLDFDRREQWWGSWESGTIKAGPRTGEIWNSWIGGVEFFDPSEEVTLGEIEEACADDPDHDWRLRIDGPMSGAVYQRHAAGHWVAIERLDGFA